MHHVTAVDSEGLAGHGIARVRQEEHDAADEIVRHCGRLQVLLSEARVGDVLVGRTRNPAFFSW